MSHVFFCFFYEKIERRDGFQVGDVALLVISIPVLINDTVLKTRMLAKNWSLFLIDRHLYSLCASRQPLLCFFFKFLKPSL